MFTNSAVQPVDSGTVHLHSDTSAFDTLFPKELLDDAFTFAVKQQKEKQTQATITTNSSNKNKTQIAVQLSDDSLPYAVRLIHELQQREENRRQQQDQNTTNDNNNTNDDEEKEKKDDTMNQRKNMIITFFILADNTFAPCCADQVTAQRNNADAIIHFGQTCFSQSIDSIPCAFFVPPWKCCSSSNGVLVKQVTKSLTQQNVPALLLEKKNNLIESVVFVFSAGIDKQELEQFKSEVLSTISQENTNSSIITFAVCGTKTHELGTTTTASTTATTSSEWNVDGATFPIAEKTGRQLLFFLSPSSTSSLQKDDDSEKPQNSPLHQLALIEYWNAARRMKYSEDNDNDDDDDASEQLLSSSITNWFTHLTTSANTIRSVATVAKDVMRRVNQRMRNVEALSHADSVGLLVMSLSISEHRNLLTKLQTLLRTGGKRVYVVFIGHLNEYKLANFADSIDVFVSLACPNSRPAFFASKDDNFNVPLLFPAEVTLWYERDVKNIPEETVGEKFLSPDLFTTRAAKSLSHVRVVDDGKQNTTTTTTTEQTNLEGCDEKATAIKSSSGEDGTLIVKAPMHIATTSNTKGTLTKFQEKSYHGLDPRYGQDGVQSDMVVGLSGIAKGYETQHEGDDQAVKK